MLRSLLLSVLLTGGWMLPSAGLLVAGEFNEVLSIGDAAPAWKDLPGTDGKMHSLDDFKDRDWLVVCFTCNSCDVSTAYEDRIAAFVKKHADKVGFVAINVNKIKADSLPEMKKRAKAKGFAFPYLHDETQEIARKFGALYTPEFYLLDKERKVVFMGGMDNHSEAELVTKTYLEDAVTAALTGETPEVAEAAPLGCRIRFARRREE